MGRRRRQFGGFCALVVSLAISASMYGLVEAPSVGAGLVRVDAARPLPLTSPGSVLNLTRQGPLLWTSPSMAFESLQAGYPSIVWDAGLYKMWYFGCTPAYGCSIGYATSLDGRLWTKQGPVLSPSLPQDSQIAAYPEVVKIGAAYRMWYGGFDRSHYRILAATSADGTNWTKVGVAIDVGPYGSQDGYFAVYPRVVFAGDRYLMWYTGISSPTPPNSAIMLARSTNGLNWTKAGVVLDRGPAGGLDAYAAFAGTVNFDGTMYRMIYDGSANATSSLFLYATSTTGSQWQKQGIALSAQPPMERLIAFPDIVPRGGQWLVYYTARANVSDANFYSATGPSPSTFIPGGSGLPLTLTILAVTAPGAAVLLVFGWYFWPRKVRPTRGR